ncbi:hypothetical protein [Streptomyces collinus]|uniref:hypothetical protein n=1 Tax=Streptomyces collinus TaxID=42684 RepID=UPI00381B26C2
MRQGVLDGDTNRGEVEVLDRDRQVVASGEVQQADQGVAELGIARSASPADADHDPYEG